MQTPPMRDPRREYLAPDEDCQTPLLEWTLRSRSSWSGAGKPSSRIDISMLAARSRERYPMKASFAFAWLSLLAASAGSAAVCSSQTAGEVDGKGRVLTKVVVTMNEPGSFGRPVAGLTFLVVTENGDRVSVVTDDAGVASTWLVPASYRFVTPDPVEWQNKAYSWDVIVPVKAGSAVIKFSQDNATKVLAVMAPTVTPVTVAGTGSTRPVNQPGLQSQTNIKPDSISVQGWNYRHVTESPHYRRRPDVFR